MKFLLALSLCISINSLHAMRFLNSKVRHVVKMRVLRAPYISAPKVIVRNIGSSLIPKSNSEDVKHELENHDEFLKNWLNFLEQVKKDAERIKTLGFDLPALVQVINDPCEFKRTIRVHKHNELGAVAQVDFNILCEAYNSRRMSLTKCLEALHSLKDKRVWHVEPEVDYKGLIEKATKERDEIDESLKLLMSRNGKVLPVISESF